MSQLVSDVTPRSQYTAAASQTVFTIPFEFQSNDDVKCYVNGALNTAYSLSGAGVTGGGSLTFSSGRTAGDIVTIIRDMAIARASNRYAAYGPLPGDVLEEDQIAQTMRMQQLERDAGYAIRGSITESGSDADFTLPTIASRKGKFLKFNSTTGAVEVADVSTTVGAISRSIIGDLFYPQSAAEAGAPVTPTNTYALYTDVARQGALGDGSTVDTAAVQKAFDVARLARARVHFPSLNKNGQTIYVVGTINVYEDTYVTADPGVRIRSAVTGSTAHVFDSISTLGTGTALTANAAKRDASVVVTSATGLSIGQIVCIRDTTYKWSTNARNLEFNEISDVSSTTITLKQRLIGTYLTANAAELVPLTTPARNIKFENVVVEIPTTKDGGAFYFQDAYNCELLNCQSSGQKGQAAFTAWRSAYIRVHGGLYRDGQSQSTPGYGYGGTFSQSSHHCVAYGVQFRNVRECAVSLGARFSGYIDCDSASSYDNAFNSHADGSEDCFFINCRSSYARSKGFYAGGITGQAPDKRIRFINCESVYSGSYGFFIEGSAGVEPEDIEVVNCKSFHAGDDTATTYGYYASRATRPRLVNFQHDSDGETNLRACAKVEICTDAKIVGGSYRGQSGGWGILHANCTGVTIDGVDISSVGSNQGVHAESTASTKVVVRNVRVDNDVVFTKNTGDLHRDITYSTKYQNASGAQASATDGSTISHGLVTTPTNVRCTSSVAGEFVSVTALGGSTFTVAIKKHDNTAGTSQTVYWEAAV